VEFLRGRCWVQFCSFVISKITTEYNVSYIMYANDTKLFRESSMDVYREELQRDLDVLYEWAEKWQLRFAVGKCKNRLARAVFGLTGRI